MTGTVQPASKPEVVADCQVGKGGVHVSLTYPASLYEHFLTVNNASKAAFEAAAAKGQIVNAVANRKGPYPVDPDTGLPCQDAVKLAALNQSGRQLYRTEFVLTQVF